MKGFVITPVLFIALFLIAGIMMITFMTIDKRVAGGINAEAALRKAQADLLENRTGTEDLLFYASVDSADVSGTEAELKAGIEASFSPVSLAFDPAQQPKWFTVNYTYDFSRQADAVSIEKSVTASSRVSCAAINAFHMHNISILLGDSRWLNCTV